MDRFGSDGFGSPALRRRCALPGCDALVEETPDRPGKIYCTAAHRVAARRERRAAAQAAGDDRLTETLPWLRETPQRPLVRSRAVPARVAAPVREEPEPEPGELPGARSPWMAGLARRRRAIAVLGATAVLVGGYALTTSSASSPDPSPPTVTLPEGTTDEEWARRAQLALVAVNEQLDTIGETERAWNSTPAAQQVGTAPSAVRQLLERRRVLEQQRATLQSQLETYRELERASDELRQADSRLDEIQRLLDAAATPPSRSAADTSWATALSEQRDLRARHRDAVASQVQNLSEGVRTATRSPLPNDADRTDRVREEVLRLARNPTPSPMPSQGVDERPPLVQGRDQDESRPSGEVGTSGPPDPRGPGDDTEETPRHDHSGDARALGSGSQGSSGPRERGGQGGGLTGAVSGTVDGVGGTLGLNGQQGGRPDQGSGDRKDRGRGQPGGQERQGPGQQQGPGHQGPQRGGVTGAVSDTVDGVGGTLGLDGGRQASPQGPDRGGSAQARTERVEAEPAQGRADRSSGADASRRGAEQGGGGAPARRGVEQQDAGTDPGSRTPRPVGTGNSGLAGAVAGPMISTMTGGLAAPQIDEALRLADREADRQIQEKLRQRGAATSSTRGTGRSTPVRTVRDGPGWTPRARPGARARRAGRTPPRTARRAAAARPGARTAPGRAAAAVIRAAARPPPPPAAARRRARPGRAAPRTAARGPPPRAAGAPATGPAGPRTPGPGRVAPRAPGPRSGAAAPRRAARVRPPAARAAAAGPRPSRMSGTTRRPWPRTWRAEALLVAASDGALRHRRA
ncbi:hypothetical protein [Pseudonocardia sp. T1-2H]|uniref:hypothetical protein n=1 Tax=Pseudonocardia sp. T1-2H TaxID=3128899 RepID=UPI0031011E0D